MGFKPTILVFERAKTTRGASAEVFDPASIWVCHDRWWSAGQDINAGPPVYGTRSGSRILTAVELGLFVLKEASYRLSREGKCFVISNC
jgi:hypothetical protein